MTEPASVIPVAQHTEAFLNTGYKVSKVWYIHSKIIKYTSHFIIWEICSFKHQFTLVNWSIVKSIHWSKTSKQHQENETESLSWGHTILTTKTAAIEWNSIFKLRPHYSNHYCEAAAMLDSSLRERMFESSCCVEPWANLWLQMQYGFLKSINYVNYLKFSAVFGHTSANNSILILPIFWKQKHTIIKI